MKINDKVFEQFPLIRTERLYLREIQLSDAASIFEMRSSGRVNQFIARENMVSMESSVGLVEKTIAAFQNRQGIGWAGVLQSNGAMIGTCGFNQLDFQNLRAEIGGELNVEYWGKKLALEAVEAIVRFGLETLHLHAIEAKVSPGNRGAIFLLEALGFKKEAHFTDRIYFRGKYSDMAVYTLIKGNEIYNH